MNKLKVAAFLVGCGFVAALSGCSDFSDYNETPVDQLPAGNLTLWDNISQNAQLSDFAALVKRTGFESKLSEPRAYTVWAPLNGSYDAAAYQQLSDSLLLQQFVKNHVAEYTHVATGSIDERIHTLNAKSFTFTGNGTYTFGHIAVAQPNQPGSNGVMHLLDGVAKFYPNLFEYLNMADGISLLRDYFMQYNDTTLSDESVKGPMVDGVQTYLDSVLVISNSLMGALNARLDNEDSTYTFIMPLDAAYQKMYDHVKPFYNFISKTTVQAPEVFTTASGTNTKYVEVNASHLSDSLTRRAIVRNLIFSNNDAYNEWVVGKGINTDTLRSTTRTKFSNPADIISKYLVGQPYELSNGYARFVDSLAFYPWETYNPVINVNPRPNLANAFSCSGHIESVPDSLLQTVFGPDMAGETNFRYVWLEPSSANAKPDAFFTLPNVRSATYNFYVVFMPSAWRQFGNDDRPNMLNFQLSYCKANGSLDTYYFSKAYADSLLSGGTLPKLPTKVDATTAFYNDPQVADTVFIGRFTFPVSYSGLGDEYCPNIRITSPINVFNKQQLATYTRDLRIAAIILRPVEYEEFVAKNK